MNRRLLPISILILSLLACQRASAPKDVGEGESGLKALPQGEEGKPVLGVGFEVGWDPATGKGLITQRMPDGDRYDLCLQCRYPGYAGGLWIGSMNGSGLLWTPKEPSPGFPSLNLFCAQDESLWDHEEGLEYDCGWSENFGRGDDGVRMEYLDGEILQDGRQGSLVLRSFNRGGCWEATRYLSWPDGAAYVLIASHVRNVCDAPRRLSFWTGEDPWIGTYKTSEGDVGWTNEGLVRAEVQVDPGTFRWGGLYDLGNELSGESPGAFSGAANFIMPDPGTPPDRVLFANRFAHGEDELTPGKPLDNKTLTAINLGWVDRVLGPGETLRVVVAMGKAETGGIGVGAPLPQLPEMAPEAWEFDRVYHRATEDTLRKGPAATAPRFDLPIRFREEMISVTVDPPWVSVDGLYIFENRTDGPHQATLFYPVPVDAAHPLPETWDVKGARWRKAPKGILWRLQMEPRQELSVQVKYRQRCDVPEARYILTSTARWGDSLDKGAYEVRWPTRLSGVDVSYDGERFREGDWEVLRFAREDFLPDRDLLIRWTSD
ncbi:MAG: hypothetical protein ABIK09_18855 [Pseudomonadota bacterium]